MNRFRENVTVERVLLVAVACMQIAILVRLQRPQPAMVARTGPPERPAEREPLVAAGQRQRVAPPSGSPGRQPAGGLFPRRSSDVFDEMDAMLESMLGEFSQVSRLLQTSRAWDGLVVSPAMDMKEQDGEYVVLFSLPPIDPRLLHVALEGQLLTVLSRTRVGHMHSAPPLERRVLLPGPVDDAAARAVYTNGILRVTIPKAESKSSQSGRFRLL